jgi:hypothetical protein
MDNSNYKNNEIKIHSGGEKRNVTIKRGKCSKSVTKYHKGKKISTSRKQIHKKNVLQIKMGKIIPGLFSDFSKKIIRNKKGGTQDVTIDELKTMMSELQDENNKIIEILQNRQTILNVAMVKLNNPLNSNDTNTLLAELIQNLETQIAEFNNLNNHYEEKFEILYAEYKRRTNN